jgi:hypothetical protein
VLATLSASRTSTLSHRGASSAEALTGGYHLAFWIAAGLVGCGIAVVLATLPRRVAPVTEAAGQGAAG